MSRFPAASISLRAVAPDSFIAALIVVFTARDVRDIVSPT